MSGSARPNRRTVFAGLGALAALGAAAPAIASVGDPARIEIEGNRFTCRGRTLRLTGVAVGDPMYIRQPRPASDYETIAGDWLGNCVRISVFPGHWRADREAVLTALAIEVSIARSLGLFVIIDWHPIGFPDHHEPLIPAEWGLPLDAFLSTIDEAHDFWTAMAARYGDDPAVLFEIWNEPVVEERHWVADGKHWPILLPAWEEIISTIRARSDNIVLAAGGYWAHDLVGIRDNPIRDPRTAYVWHAYPNANRNDPSGRLRSLGGLHETKPIVITEWGFCMDCGEHYFGTVETFGRPLADDIIEPFGLSHTAWCYSVGALPNLLAADDGTPSVAGAFVRDLLRQSATQHSWMLAT